MSAAFLKMLRTPATEALLADPNALALLAQVALRARRARADDCARIGEALIGDFRSLGLSKKQYRRAKERLERRGLAAFRGTARGTVARLIGKTVFDPNLTERA